MRTVELKMPWSALKPLAAAVEAKLRELERGMEARERSIRRYEIKYGMCSEEFLERYLRGELGGGDYGAWYEELRALETAKREYEALMQVMISVRRSLLRERG